MKILITASNMVHINNFHLPYIEKFKEQGDDVYVLASGVNADFNVGFKKKLLSVKNLLLTFKIRRILKKEQFDVVMLNTSLCAFYVRLAMKGLKKRPHVINTVHGYLFSLNSSKVKRSIYLLCEKFLRKQTDNIIVMNDEDLEIATSNRLCLDKIYRCDGMGFVKRLSTKQNSKSISEKTRLTFVGEISKRKNQQFLIKALKSLKNADLTLVGDGKERKRLEKLIKKLRIDDRVRITGFTKDIGRYLAETDIYVSASSIEGLPFNILEAMEAGLPIVASDIKGHRDLLPKDCLYELNNQDEFVKKIEKAFENKVKYDVEKYRLKNALKNNMEIYNLCIKNYKLLLQNR